MIAIRKVRQRLGDHDALDLDPNQRFHHASVATILAPTTNGLEILLIKRNEHPTDRWSGHMAFPGGRFETSDASFEETARRETAEEVGLDLRRDAALIGKLDDLQAIAKTGQKLPLVISPFVYVVKNGACQQLTPRSEEVSAIVWIPLDPMFRGEFNGTFSYRRGNGMEIPFPCFDFGPYKVWGLTYQMLTGFFGLLK